MSVQINCDRCGENTHGSFINANIKIQRGTYASIASKISPTRRGLPLALDWQVCERCEQALREWQMKPDAAAEAV